MKEKNQDKIFEEIDRILTERGPRETPPQEFGGLHLAASLREKFTVDSLRQDALAIGIGDEKEQDQELENILGDSQFFLSEDGSMYWEYRKDKKRQVLKQAIAQGKALPTSQKLEANQQMTRQEQAVQRIMAGDLVSWEEEEDTASLRSTLEAASLLEGLAEVPEKSAIRKRIAWLETLQPFRLLTENFRGRKEELKELREYVDFLPPEDAREGVTRFIRRGLDRIGRILSLHKHPLLVISGIGGVGKSALVARFILNHLEVSEQAKEKDGLIFVYMDFDHRTISLQDPLDILRETARQLAMQLPGYEEEFARLEEAVSRSTKSFDRLPGAKTAEDPFQLSTRSGGDRGWEKAQTRQVNRSDSQERNDLIYQLDQIWSNLPDKIRKAPFMLVLDSFEEVHRFGDGLVLEVFKFLRDWSEIMPRFRPILVGRTPITNLPIAPQSLHLREFDQESALAFLMARGVDDPAMAHEVVRQFGSHPLSLKLAAEFIRKEKESGEHPGSPLKKGLLRHRMDTMLAQNDLFQRNLAHVQDPLARKIAFPGLVVRRISPEIIREVLAVPCGLGEVTPEKSQELFNALESETFLVAKIGEEQLQFRKDLRSLVLPHVLGQDPARSRAIQDAAISFYQNRTGLEDRAEYVYHRLLRGDQPYEMDNDLMLPGMVDQLGGSLGELPVEAHLYLASRWSIPVPPEIKEKADLASWENNLASEIDSASESGLFDETLRLYLDRLSTPEERSKLSPLPFREARLWLEMGKLDKAWEAIELAEVIGEQKGDATEVWRIRLVKRSILERKGFYSEAAELISFPSVESIGADIFVNEAAEWLKLKARGAASWEREKGFAKGFFAKLNSPNFAISLGFPKMAMLIRNIFLPCKAFGLSDSSLSWIANMYSTRSILEELPEKYGPPNLQGSLELLEGPLEDLESLKFHLSAAEFNRVYAASREAWPDYSTLSEASHKIFNDRLGNVVSSNIYETALYEFVLALEKYGRWDVMAGLDLHGQ